MFRGLDVMLPLHRRPRVPDFVSAAVYPLVVKVYEQIQENIPNAYSDEILVAAQIAWGVILGINQPVMLSSEQDRGISPAR